MQLKLFPHRGSDPGSRECSYSSYIYDSLSFTYQLLYGALKAKNGY